MKVLLKKNSWLTSLYMWTYCLTNKTNSDYMTEEQSIWYYGNVNQAQVLPTNLCKYFWGLVFAIITLPFTIWSYPVQWINIKPGHYIPRLLCSVVILLTIGGIIGAIYKTVNNPHKALEVALIVLVIIVLLIFIILSGIGIEGGLDAISNSEVYKTFKAKAADKNDPNHCNL